MTTKTMENCTYELRYLMKDHAWRDPERIIKFIGRQEEREDTSTTIETSIQLCAGYASMDKKAYLVDMVVRAYRYLQRPIVIIMADMRRLLLDDSAGSKLLKITQGNKSVIEFVELAEKMLTKSSLPQRLEG